MQLNCSAMAPRCNLRLTLIENPFMNILLKGVFFNAQYI